MKTARSPRGKSILTTRCAGGHRGHRVSRKAAIKTSSSVPSVSSVVKKIVPPIHVGHLSEAGGSFFKKTLQPDELFSRQP